MMTSPPDRDLIVDEGIIAEIDLLTELIIAATLSPDSLTQERIDDLLGVTHDRAQSTTLSA